MTFADNDPITVRTIQELLDHLNGYKTAYMRGHATLSWGVLPPIARQTARYAGKSISEFTDLQERHREHQKPGG